VLRSIIKTILIELVENKSRVRFVERRENRHSESDKEENGLLVVIVEQTDVINLYGRGTVPHALSRFFYDAVFVCSMTILRQRKKDIQLEDDSMKISLHLLIVVVTRQIV
jgi:hypothetical protein